jgi:serine protease Do
MATLFAALNDELAGVVSAVRQSVVEVRDGRRGVGAGTIWHSDGLILTNAHVARHGGLQVALQDGRVLRAQTIARDDERDLAALAIEANDLPTIQPGSARSIHAGQWVLALGHPWGISNAATGGIVIGMSGRAPEMPDVRNDWVVVDLHLRPGNSGGPLVDVQGRLIGVNTMMTGPGVGIAVSVDAAKAFLRERIGVAAGVSGTPSEVV